MKPINDYIKLTGLSQAEVARRAGISPTVLNNLLKGRRAAGVKTLQRLSKATGISIEKLVNG